MGISDTIYFTVLECLSHEDCSLCKKCSASNTCEYQTEGEDMKNECPEDSCKYGYCDGTGACEMKPTVTDCGICALCDASGNCNVYDPTQNSECDPFDLTEITTCTNDPDNNSFTWDSRNLFDSYCIGLNECQQGDPTITHTCSVSSCGAECDGPEDCEIGICSADCTCSVVTIPTVTIISPIPKNYSVEVVWLNVTADIPVDSWEYEINDGGRQSFTPNTTIDVNRCYNNLTVYATASGQEGSASVEFYTLTGDSIGDRIVNIFDIVKCAGMYGFNSTNPGFESVCDMVEPPDGSGKIDIFDIVAAAGNYMESC